jgi:hypothetical protein
MTLGKSAYRRRCSREIFANPCFHSSNWVGSTADLIRFRYGLSSNNEARKIDWWTDETCIESYKLIIDFLLNRTNSINGIKYSEDPTILAWETGMSSSSSLRCKCSPLSPQVTSSTIEG